MQFFGNRAKSHDFARDFARDSRYVRIKGSEWTRYTHDGDDAVLGDKSDWFPCVPVPAALDFSGRKAAVSRTSGGFSRGGSG